MSLLSVHFAVFRVFFNVELYDLENKKKMRKKNRWVFFFYAAYKEFQIKVLDFG